MAADDLSVESWELSRVIPYENNPRRPGDGVAAVARSLQAYGWRQPLVVDAAGVLVVGHVRLMAARELGLERVPVHVMRDVSPELVRAYRLADNKTHDNATWDLGTLAAELEALQAAGADLAAADFSEDDLAHVLGDASRELGGLPPADPRGVPAERVVSCPKCGHEFGVGL